MPTLRIGGLAERTGTNAPTIRYYEEIGLLPVANRKSGGQRVYDKEDVKRLTLIRRCREFGFSIEQVKSLVALLDDRERSCLELRDMARDHLATVQGKLKELRALERSIARFVETCNSLCLGGPGPDCAVLDELSMRHLPYR
jgi:DNA-binding transcriptional MerR regulator